MRLLIWRGERYIGSIGLPFRLALLVESALFALGFDVVGNPPSRNIHGFRSWAAYYVDKRTRQRIGEAIRTISKEK